LRCGAALALDSGEHKFWLISAFLLVAVRTSLEEKLMTKAMTRFITDEAGADLIEYALLAALVSLGAVLTLTQVGAGINGLYGKMNTKIASITIP
jgi:pilus assembly protein Flp/PilA